MDAAQLEKELDDICCRLSTLEFICDEREQTLADLVYVQGALCLHSIGYTFARFWAKCFGK